MLAAAMRMIVVLAMGFRIVDVAGGVVIELVERTLSFEHLADDVSATLSEQTIAFEDSASRFGHL
jgi:hypothetical protein